MPFKTHAELVNDSVYIQPNEPVRSGDPGGTIGINRALSALSANTDALFEKLQRGTSITVGGGGTIAWNSTSGVLSWSATILLRFLRTDGTATIQQINAGSVTLSADGAVATSLIDPSNHNATIAIDVYSSKAAWYAALDATTRFNAILLAERVATNLHLMDGRVIRNGFSLALGGARDTQYGQQEEVDQIRADVTEDRHMKLGGGGTVTWDATAVSSTVGRLRWTDPFVLLFPRDDGIIELEGTLISSEHTADLEDGQVAYILLNRSPSGVTQEAVQISNAGDGDLADDNAVVICQRQGDQIHFLNGSTFADGDSGLLGGIRTGLQWHYVEQGPSGGDPVTDFGEDRAYTVGQTGASRGLLVYRNGLLANRSAAWWDGTWPAGSLSGSIADHDEYLEEDQGNQRGTRILWLADDGGTPGHASGTHGAVTWTHPDEDDIITALIGVQGQGPSPVESVTIEGGETFTGTVTLRAGDGIALSKEDGKLKIAVNSDVGVKALIVDGSSTVAIGGNITLVPGIGVAIEDNGATEDGEITLALDLSEDQFEALTGADGDGEDPSATNPFVLRSLLFKSAPHLQGFDQIYTRTNGSIRVSAGRFFSHNAMHDVSVLDVEIDDVYSGDTLSAPMWGYLYVFYDGADVYGRISSTPPGADGLHPDSTEEAPIFFLSSVYIASATEFGRFHKSGSTVLLQQVLHTIVLNFDGSDIDLSDKLPATGSVSIEMQVTFRENPLSGAVEFGYGQRSEDVTLTFNNQIGAMHHLVISSMITQDYTLYVRAPIGQFTSVTGRILKYTEGRSGGVGAWRT